MATQTTERSCPICGNPVTDETNNRFGEWCCSGAHAEEYVAEVRADKQRQVAAATQGPAGRREGRQWGCCG